MTEVSPGRGLLDTSIFIARESGRPIGKVPDSPAVSVVTVAELYIGVLMAASDTIRERRRKTFDEAMGDIEILPVDTEVALRFAELTSRAKRAGMRAKIIDMLIAATAVRHGLPVYTQDADFLQIDGLTVYRV